MAGNKALIIDDEIDIVEILHSWLEELGYESDSANDVDSAIRLLKGVQYSVIICDLKMPGKSGGDLMKFILENDPLLIERFILMTGTIVDDDMEDDLRSYGARILKKPFMLAEMKAVISSLTSD
ncbi:MAG: response regulator [Nitrospirota bacterium]|nr:MAG: response regulator [Nitrospirota bacterium]